MQPTVTDSVDLAVAVNPVEAVPVGLQSWAAGCAGDVGRDDEAAFGRSTRSVVSPAGGAPD